MFVPAWSPGVVATGGVESVETTSSFEKIETSLTYLVLTVTVMPSRPRAPSSPAVSRLNNQTLLLILKLFSTGLESAAVSDAVFFKALDLVANLLPLASPPPPPASSAPGATVKEKPPPSGSGAGAVLIPRSALEDVVNQAAVRATRPPRRPRTEAEEERIKEAFAAVFARSPPGWADKLAECAARHAEKASRKAPPPSEGGDDGGGERVGDGEAGSAGAGAGGRPSRSISIKGPKRERDEAGGGGGANGSGGSGGGGLDAARKKKSRRVHV